MYQGMEGIKGNNSICNYISLNIKIEPVTIVAGKYKTNELWIYKTLWKIDVNILT